MVIQKDELGITPTEDAAIAALSGGVDQETVDKASRGRVSVQMVPTEKSEFDTSVAYNQYPGESEFADIQYKPEPKSSASRKAMYTSLATRRPDQYENMYDQMATSGYSSSLDVLQQEVNKQTRQEYQQDAEKAASQGDVDALERLYKAAPSILSDDALPNPLAFKNASQSVLERSEGITRNAEHAKGWLEGLHSWATTREKIVNNLIHGKIAESDPRLSNYSTDIVDLALFGEQPFALSNIGKEFFGEKYLVLGGTMFRDLAQLVRNQPTPEAQYAMADKVVESVARNAGVIKDNDFVKTYALDTFRLMLEAPGGDDKVTRWLTDIFGVVDIVSVIPTALAVKWTRGLIGLKRNRSALSAYNTIRGELAEIDPDLEAVLKSRAITDENAANKLGTTPEDELLQVMPKSAFDEEFMLSGAPNSVIDVFTNTKSKANEVLRFTENTFRFADEEYVVKQRRIMDALNDEELSGIARPSESEIVSRNLDRNTVTIRATYGNETDRPLTLSQAVELKGRIDYALQDEGIEQSTKILGFTTSKGSTYTINKDLTVRNKAARPEHPGEEGIQPESKKTVYVSDEDVENLHLLQAKGGDRTSLVFDDRSKSAAIRYTSGPNKGKLIKGTVTAFSTTPKVGLIPIEYFGDNFTVHFGNKITSLRTESNGVSELFIRNKATGLLEKFDEKLHIIDRREVTPMTISDRRGNLFPNPLKRPYGKKYKALNPNYSGFTVSVRTEAPLRNMDTLPGTVLGDGATKGHGFYSRWYINPQSWMDKRILGAFRVAGDQKSLIKHELFKLVKPFTTLSYSNKKRVANLLEVGDERQHIFSYEELKGRYSNKVIEAYYSTRILEDAIYRIKNHSVRQQLLDDGYRAVHIPLGEGVEPFQNAFRQVDALPPEVREVFDPATGRAIPVTQHFMETIDQQGLRVGRVLSGVDRGNSKNNYIVVRQDHITDLPTNVFPYRKGHMFRINNDPYFIDQYSTKIVDGVPQEVKRTIAVEPNNSKAKRTLDRLNQLSRTGETYKIRIDRNFTMEESALKNDIDALGGSGDSFWFSKRGERLTRFTDNSLSSVEDPLVSLDRATSSVANVVTHGRLMDTEIERHRKTYGHLRGNGNQQLWYWSGDEKTWKFSKEAAQQFNDPSVRAALHSYEYLEQMKYTPTTVDTKWKELMAQFDSAFGNYGDLVSTASKKVFLDTFGSTTPGRAARGFAFATTIPLRPIRHVMLQGSTGLYLTGIDPAATVKSFRDGGLMMLSMASYDNPRLWPGIKKWAKLYGYTEDEWDEVFTAFRKSGKAYSVDTHVAVGEFNFSWSRSIPDTAFGEMGRNLVNIAKSPVTSGKAIGFDVGELNNQAVTWMFAKRQWEKANPGKKFNSKQKYLDEINAEARNLSVDMTKTDALRYQIGAFASMTQFLAIHNKMLMKIFGTKWLGDATHSGDNLAQIALTKGKLMAGLFAIYGSAGWGAQELYDSWKKENNIEFSPMVDRFAFGGMMQVFFDGIFDLSFNLPQGTTRTTISDSVSPTGGVFTAGRDLARSLWDGNFLEALAGPSGSQFPNVFKAATFARQAWGFEDLDTLQKVGLSMQVAAEEFGMMSDYFRFNMAMAYKDKLDELYIVGKDGRPVAEANAVSEIWAKFLFATGNRDEFELYSKWFSASKEYNSFGKTNEGKIDKDAKELTKWMYRKYAESDGDFMKFADTVRNLTWSLHRGNRVYGLKVAQKAQAFFSLDPKFGRFIEDYARNFMLVDPNASKKDIINSIMNSDFVPEENKQHIIDSIEQWSISRDLDKELLDRLVEEK